MATHDAYGRRPARGAGGGAAISRRSLLRLRLSGLARRAQPGNGETLDDERRAALRPDFERLLASCNNRPPGVEIDARYLVAVGRVTCP